MSSVKSKGNSSTELALIKIFKANNISGWRRHQPVVGHPDFVFWEKKIAVFADGCFWHGHKCRNTEPKDNRDFWKQKIKRNMLRDKKHNYSLKNSGWIVIRFWECEINSNAYISKLIQLKKRNKRNIYKIKKIN